MNMLHGKYADLLPRLAAFCCIGFAATIAGCSSSEHGHVVGTVTIDGQPVEGAQVRFAPKDGRAAIGTTDADGKYELNYTPGVKGAKVGPNTVYLSTAKDAVQDDNGKVVEAAVPERFPAKYNANPAETVEVKPGENVFDFAVQSGG